MQQSDRIIDGKKIANDIKQEIKKDIEDLKNKNKKVPSLAVVLVGEDPASQIYVRLKNKNCEELGIRSIVKRLDYNTSQEDLLNLIDTLNASNDINGILVQMPLPKHIDSNEVIKRINPLKDVDCFHPENLGLLFAGIPRFLPCTPSGIIELLHRKNISLTGKHCVVLGRSNIVGKPTALMLLSENATVTICHSKTKNLKEITNSADILIAAIGKPNFVTEDMVKRGAVVIDVGINRTEQGLVGDVDYKAVFDKVSYITPVPGGVGPMTIVMLLKNTLISIRASLG